MTPKAESLIGKIARVSSPHNQDNPSITPLIHYLINHQHWSPFEMVSACFDISTSRGISPQILRHRSFSFQEFSQRYASVDETGVEVYVARRKAAKNRQSSVDDLSDAIKLEWRDRQLDNWKRAFDHYKWALDNEIATECARFVLPLGTQTHMYMVGTLRSWIHYIELRTQSDTQAEHREIALQIRNILCLELPVISEALGWHQP